MFGPLFEARATTRHDERRALGNVVADIRFETVAYRWATKRGGGHGGGVDGRIDEGRTEERGIMGMAKGQN